MPRPWSPFLNALRIPFRFIARPDDIKPAIRKAYYHADSSNWPVAMVFTGECVEVVRRSSLVMTRAIWRMASILCIGGHIYRPDTGLLVGTHTVRQNVLSTDPLAAETPRAC